MRIAFGLIASISFFVAFTVISHEHADAEEKRTLILRPAKTEEKRELILKPKKDDLKILAPRTQDGSDHNRHITANALADLLNLDEFLQEYLKQNPIEIDIDQMLRRNQLQREQQAAVATRRELYFRCHDDHELQACSDFAEVAAEFCMRGVEDACQKEASTRDLLAILDLKWTKPSARSPQGRSAPSNQQNAVIFSGEHGQDLNEMEERTADCLARLKANPESSCDLDPENAVTPRWEKTTETFRGQAIGAKGRAIVQEMNTDLNNDIIEQLWRKEDLQLLQDGSRVRDEGDYEGN